jgi:TRAP-type C4-dicarboxylate transport system substrate-binding protein
VGQSTNRLEIADSAVVKRLSYAADLINDPAGFGRRVPPALNQRWHKRWDPIARSELSRAASGRSVWLARSLHRRVGSGSAAKPLVLRFANPYASRLPELEWFAEEVAEVSAGAVRIRFVNSWTTTDNPREETSAVAGVTRDCADLGWAGTRAFGCLGVRSLDPLQAPFLLEDYATLDAVCRDEVAREMLEPLDRLGLVGLVVLPGAQRKPFAFARRLVGPRDFLGAKLRIHESLVAEATYRALGAEAVILSVREMASRPDALIDGLDLQIEGLAGWGLRGSITYNVNLWPRTIAIFASRKVYRWLGTSEREVLQEAARRTLARALDHLENQEQRDLDAVPDGVNSIFADEDDLVAMRELVEPVHTSLRKHPETGAFLSRLETIRARQADRRLVTARLGMTPVRP